MEGDSFLFRSDLWVVGSMMLQVVGIVEVLGAILQQFRFLISIIGSILKIQIKTIRGFHWPVKFISAVLHRYSTAD